MFSKRLFSNFFLSPKGPPSSFLIFYSKLKFQKAQRVSPFKFFGTMRLAQNSYFSIRVPKRVPKDPPFTISKSLSFLSLRYGAFFEIFEFYQRASPCSFRFVKTFSEPKWPRFEFFGIVRLF